MWGPTPISNDLRHQVALAMKCAQPLPAMRVRVRGYGPDFGLPLQDGTTKAQAETQALFPTQEVTVIACNHMQSSGLFRPVWDLLVRGIPPDWLGLSVPSRDSTVRDRTWQLCGHSRGSLPFQAMGPRESVPFHTFRATPGDASSDDEMSEDNEPAPVLEDAFQPKED